MRNSEISISHDQILSNRYKTVDHDDTFNENPMSDVYINTDVELDQKATDGAR